MISLYFPACDNMHHNVAGVLLGKKTTEIGVLAKSYTLKSQIKNQNCGAKCLYDLKVN